MGKAKSQAKVVFYLPHRDRDGRRLRREIAAAEKELFDRFQKWTALGVVKGVYRTDDGATEADECDAYALVVDGGRVAEIEDVLRAFKAKTEQESIYMEVTPNVDVRLI